MHPLIIDLESVTPDLLQPTDNPVLTAAVGDANNPRRPMVDGAGFENKL
jgi:hypothetical protein